MHVNSLVIGLLLALFSALGTNVAFLLKFRGVKKVSGVEGRHPLHTAVQLFRSPLFAMGWGVAFVAWLLHSAALAMAPLTLVQAVLAGGLVFLGILGERFFGLKVGLLQWAGIAITAVGLTIIAVTNQSSPLHHYSLPALISIEAGAFGFGLGLAMAAHHRRISRRSRGLCLAVASGVLFGVSDVALKYLAKVLGHGPLALINPWTLAAVLALIITFYTSARSLQLGPGVPVIALTSVAANLVAIVGGVLVFHDSIGHGALAIVGRSIAFTLVLLGAALVPGPSRLHHTYS